jgi:ACS family sodium-dependent inorganic phosphate cotransporter
MMHAEKEHDPILNHASPAVGYYTPSIYDDKPILYTEDMPSLKTSSRPLLYLPQRIILCIFLCLSNVICYVDRVCMAVAIIPMSKEFGWSETTQGSILSSFYWGYLFTQIAGGILSKKFGGKVVLYTGVCLWSSLTLMMPICAQLGTKYWLGILIMTRVGLGIGEGVNFPAITHLLSIWIPKSEKSRAWSGISSGMDLGTLTALLLGPLITVVFGWEWTFYFFGSIGIVWAALFVIITSATPDDNIFISEYERSYINEAIVAETAMTEDDKNDNSNVFKFLWHVFTSTAMWAAVIAPVCFSYGNYLLGAYMPKFITFLGVPFEQSGYYSAMPYAFIAIFASLWGIIADFFINRFGVSVQNMRKIMTIISMVGTPMVWFFLRFTTHSIIMCTVLLCISSIFTAAHRSGSSMSTLDIGGPKYAGILYSISNTFQTIPGIIGPLLTGWILDKVPHVESTLVSSTPWDMVFNVMILVNLFGAVVFVIFGKGTPQFK